MKRNILGVLSIVLIIGGIGIFLYPRLNNFTYQRKVLDEKEEFIEIREEELASEEKAVLIEELYEKLKLENERIYSDKQEKLQDPFIYESVGINLKKYGIENNIIGYLNVPKIGIDVPIILGANQKNLSKGATLMTETSYPIGGENTNAVIAGHRGLPNKRMFRDIEKIEVGDLIYVENFKEKLTYKVVKTDIIEPDEIDKILIQDGKDMLSLFTCHPYRVDNMRYVVYAERVKK